MSPTAGGAVLAASLPGVLEGVDVAEGVAFVIPGLGFAKAGAEDTGGVAMGAGTGEGLVRLGCEAAATALFSMALRCAVVALDLRADVRVQCCHRYIPVMLLVTGRRERSLAWAQLPSFERQAR